MRYKALDGWRGIAALAVALFHFPVSCHVHNALLVRHAYLLVDFFFVLSGFVIAHSLRDGLPDRAAYGAFICRRLGRVYPLYALVLVSFAGAEFAKFGANAVLAIPSQTAPFAPGSYADPQALTLHFALLQPFGLRHGLFWNWPDWSIAAEVWTYAIFGLVCLLAFPHRRAVLCALLAMAFVLLFELSDRGIEVTYDLGFVRCVYGFAAGALVYDAWRKVPFAITGVLASICEVIIVAVALAFLLMSGRNGSSLLAPVVFGLVVFIFAFEGGAASRLLAGTRFQALGHLSYAIYVVHAFIVLVFTLTASVVMTHGADAAWRIEIYDGIAERVLKVTGYAFLPDAMTAVYAAAVVIVAALACRYVEAPARRAVNEWAGGLTRSSGRVAA